MQKKHVFSMVLASTVASLSVHHVLLMLGARPWAAVFLAAVVAFIGAFCSGAVAIARVANPIEVDRPTDAHFTVGIVGGVAGFTLPMTVVAVLHQVSDGRERLLGLSTLCMIVSGLVILGALLSLLVSSTPSTSTSKSAESAPAGESTPAAGPK